MPRVKTDHTLPSFVALPVVDRAQLGRFQAGLGAARALLPRHPARPLRSDHAQRHARLQVIDRLLQDPEIAAQLGVPTTLGRDLLERSQRLLQLAALALPRAWGAEEGRLLCAGVLLQSGDRLFTAAVSAQRDPQRGAREREAIEKIWGKARHALLQSRTQKLRAQRPPRRTTLSLR